MISTSSNSNITLLDALYHQSSRVIKAGLISLFNLKDVKEEDLVKILKALFILIQSENEDIAIVALTLVDKFINQVPSDH